MLFFKIQKFWKNKKTISKRHDIYSVEQNKLTLSSDDDKRYLLDGQTDTLAWEHYAAT